MGTYGATLANVAFTNGYFIDPSQLEATGWQINHTTAMNASTGLTGVAASSIPGARQHTVQVVGNYPSTPSAGIRSSYTYGSAGEDAKGEQFTATITQGVEMFTPFVGSDAEAVVVGPISASGTFTTAVTDDNGQTLGQSSASGTSASNLVLALTQTANDTITIPVHLVGLPKVVNYGSIPKLVYSWQSDGDIAIGSACSLFEAAGGNLALQTAADPALLFWKDADKDGAADVGDIYDSCSTVFQSIAINSGVNSLVQVTASWAVNGAVTETRPS